MKGVSELEEFNSSSHFTNSSVALEELSVLDILLFVF
jgi:hypothetical protein